VNIGELFVTLGAKTDASWADGLNKLKGIGTAAKSAANLAKHAMADVKHAFKGAALGADMAANRIIDASKRQAAAVEASARRMQAAQNRANAYRSPGGRAIGNMRAQLAGFNGSSTIAGPDPNRKARTVGWAQAHVGVAGLPLGLQRQFGGSPASSTTPGPMVHGSPLGAGLFGTGNQFSGVMGAGGAGGAGGGAAAGAAGGRRGGAAGSGRGRGGMRGFPRFGALGEASAFRRVILGAGIYQSVQEFGQLADTYTLLQMRIGGITNSQEEANTMFARLRDIATNTRASLESTAEGYVRIRNATEGMNLSQEDSFQLMTNLNMLLGTSGASASEARSGMMQLTQALAKGKLDGDEFRSIAENMPNILKVLQKSLKVTEGDLRRMSRAGELTREKLVKAILAAKGLKAPPATFASGWQKFKDDLMIAFGELAKNENLAEHFSVALRELAKVIIFLVNEALVPAVKGIATFIKGLRDGKPWAIGLAAAIGFALLPQMIKLVFWWGKLATSILTFPFTRVAAIKAALGLGEAAAVGAGATGANAAKAGSKGGGLLGAASSVLWPVALAYIGSELTGGPLDIWGEHGMVNSMKSRMGGGGAGAGLPGMAGGTNVSIGPTTINITATDAADVEDKLNKEMIDRMNRAAAASFNRSGS
jgi:tape measure domain-containing protein